MLIPFSYSRLQLWACGSWGFILCSFFTVNSVFYSGKNHIPTLVSSLTFPMCIVCKTLAVWKTVGRVMSALDMKSDSVETCTHRDDGDLNVRAISPPPSCPSTCPRAFNLHVLVWEKWILHDCRSCADAGRRCWELCVAARRGCRREIKHPMALNRICHFIRAPRKTRY